MPAPSDDQLDRVVSAWLAYQHDQDPELRWALVEESSWFARGDFMTAWRFVKAALQQSDASDAAILNIVGAGPLENFVRVFRQRALHTVGEEIANFPALREALTSVWCGEDAEIRADITELLRPYGKEASAN